VIRRAIYPGIASTWGFLRDLTGRQRRLRTAADSSRRAAEKRHRLASWNRTRDR
jgi:hypothetical protein